MSLKIFIIIYLILEKCTLISNYSAVVWMVGVVVNQNSYPFLHLTNNNSFVLGFLCYHYCHFVAVSPLCIRSLHWFLFFLWVVFTCVLFCLVLLTDGFSSLIYYYYYYFVWYYWLVLCFCTILQWNMVLQELKNLKF